MYSLFKWITSTQAVKDNNRLSLGRGSIFLRIHAQLVCLTVMGVSNMMHSTNNMENRRSAVGLIEVARLENFASIFNPFL